MLEIGDRHLVITELDETVGSYPLDRVTATRVDSDRFEIGVGDERLVFVAEDAIRFCYEGMPAIAAGRTLGSPLVERVSDWLRALTGNRAEAADVETPEEPQTHRSFEYALPEMRWGPKAPVVTERPTTMPTGVGDWARAGLPVDSLFEDVVPAAAPARVDDAPVVTCVGIRSDGKPCGSTAVGESGLCFAHDPARHRERRQVQEQTVLAADRVRKLPTENLDDVVARLERAVAEVHEGRLDPQRALAMASLAQAIVDTIEVAKSEEARRNRA